MPTPNQFVDDIRSAILSGISATESLKTWPLSTDGYRLCDNRLYSLHRGLKAIDDIAGRLADGKMHVEPPRNYKSESCTCSAMRMPPCSFCTDPNNHPEE